MPPKLAPNKMRLPITRNPRTKMPLSNVVRDTTEVSTVVEVVTANGVVSVEVAAVEDTTRILVKTSLASSPRQVRNLSPEAEVATGVVATEVATEAREVIEVVTAVPERAPVAATVPNRRVRLSLLSRASPRMRSERL